jgi:hypothetical protein
MKNIIFIPVFLFSLNSAFAMENPPSSREESEAQDLSEQIILALKEEFNAENLQESLEKERARQLSRLWKVTWQAGSVILIGGFIIDPYLCYLYSYPCFNLPDFVYEKVLQRQHYFMWPFLGACLSHMASSFMFMFNIPYERHYKIKFTESIALKLLQSCDFMKSSSNALSGNSTKKYSSIMTLLENNSNDLTDEMRENLFFFLVKTGDAELFCSYLGLDEDMSKEGKLSSFRNHMVQQKCAIDLDSLSAHIYSDNNITDKAIVSPTCDCKIIICKYCFERMQKKECPTCRSSEVKFNLLSCEKITEIAERSHVKIKID